MMAEKCFETSKMSHQEEHKEWQSLTEKRPGSPISSCVSLKSDRSMPNPPNFKGESDPQERENEGRPHSPVSSCVSLKSDLSMPNPPNFSDGSPPLESLTEKRTGSPISSCVSLKSDRSMPNPPNFKGESDPQERENEGRPHSPVSSCVSLKSDLSMPNPPNFSDGSPPLESLTEKRPGSPISSCVSLKSDRSMPNPPNFKGESDPQERENEGRPHSPVSSCVSLKSDLSMPNPPNFSDGSPPLESLTEKRPGSPISSCVSLKSDRSMPNPPNFKGESDPQERENEGRPHSPVSSCVSLKSDLSMPNPPNFSDGSPPLESGTEKKPDPRVSSCVSMKSDRSMPNPPNFSDGSAPALRESGTEKKPGSPISSCVSLMSDRSMSNFKKEPDPQERTEKKSDSTLLRSVSVKSETSVPDRPNFKGGTDSQKRNSRKTTGPSACRKMSQRQNQRQTSVAQQREDSESVFSGETIKEKQDHSDKPQHQPKDFFDVFNVLERKMLVFIKHELEMYKKILRKENTDYYRKIKQTKWDLKQTVLNMTLSFLKKMKQCDVAAALQNELIGIIQRPLKEALKKKNNHVCEGIAKQGESANLDSIYTDLYITEGGAGQVNKEHEVRRIEKNQMQQDVPIKCNNMFGPLPGEERPIRTVLTQGVAGVGKSICVQKFILDWANGIGHQDIQFIFPLPFRELNLKKGHHSLMDIICFFFPETKGLILTDQNKVMFILDGLDECKLPLAFQKNEILNNVCKQARLDVVLTNLIKGNLLPSAQIWITTRPAAASKIPAECVDRVSEVRGFNDQQKEAYFKKKISDKDLANKIIEHIKQSRSLFIMCHIPVFCWISATVLRKILEETVGEETPKTLTNMYTCFLIFQTVQGNVKYNGKNASDIPWDKEAILSLGKLAFQNLEENNLIFYAESLEACGIDTGKISVYSGLCTQETGVFLGTVFSFVHLSIQEFLAAVFAYICVKNENRNVFDPQSTSQERKTTNVIDFLKTAVDKAFESDHGHLDLFLRFLLGLSLQSNEDLIRGLLTQKENRSDCQKEIVEYIKLKFRENTSPERSINLFYCLNELNDDSLVKEIQSYMSSGRLSEAELSPAQWSALVFVLLTSKEKLDVFDLQKFIRSEECLNRLLPVVKEATSAQLSDCNLTERSCSALLEVLSAESSALTILDLSNNPIQDSGVELLCEGLKSPNCKMEKLRLSDCKFTEKSCSALLKVLNSEFTKLTLLDLSKNTIHDSGVERLSEGLKSPNCKLENLSLSFCSITGKGYESLASALKSNSSTLIELDLRGNDPGDKGVKELTGLLEDPNMTLKKLSMLKSSDAENICKSLTKALGTNPLLLEVLDLGGKIQGDSEMKMLSEMLADSHCRTKILKLNNNRITEKGCDALSSALCSNPSHLKGLDLSGNNLGNSGMQTLCCLLENAQFKLSNLQLCDCNITESSSSLTSALKSNPSHLKELGLSKNKVGNPGVMQLSDLLKTPNCSVKKLNLSFCGISEEGYVALHSALQSNTSQLIELDLRGNNPGEKGVELLLEDPNCTLETLRLLSHDAEKVCAFLKIGTNPLLLRELDLSGKIQGDSDMQQISDLLKDTHCGTKKLKLNNVNLTQKGCTSLSSALCCNPSHLIELDLSGNVIGNDGVKQISLLLKTSSCKLSKLNISDCKVTKEGYATLASVLKSSHLKELDLRGNDPGDNGVKKLTDLQLDPNCQLDKLRFLKTPAEEAWTTFSSALGINLLLQTELQLSRNPAGLSGDSRVKKLCDFLQDTHCKLRKLQINDDDLTEKSCAALASVLPSSSLRDLDLSNNNLQDSGVKELCSGLENHLCKLETLSLSFCSITEDGYTALASALKANSIHMKKFDFRGNEPGETGVQQITSVFINSRTQLRLLKSDAADQIYTYLKTYLRKDPLLHKEMDLSRSKPKNVNVMQLSELLKDPHCRLQKLTLYTSGSIKAEESAHLVSALILNPSHLRELDLNENKLDNSGLLKLCSLLENPDCKLETLRLNKSIPEKTWTDLVSALCKNPSYIKELNLSENEIGDSGMKELCALLSNQDCKLQKLLLKNCKIKEEGCTALTLALTTNSSHMKELDLRGNSLGDPAKLLYELMNSKCNLKYDSRRFLDWLFGRSKTTQQSDDRTYSDTHELGQEQRGVVLTREDQGTWNKDETDRGDWRMDQGTLGEVETNRVDQRVNYDTRGEVGTKRHDRKMDQGASGEVRTMRHDQRMNQGTWGEVEINKDDRRMGQGVMHKDGTNTSDQRTGHGTGSQEGMHRGNQRIDQSGRGQAGKKWGDRRTKQ